MRGKILFFTTALAIFTLLMAGCGGGGGQAPAPVATSVNKGVITAAGNIAVNGFIYETSSASITLDGLPRNKSDLQVGMVVTVRGIFDNRTSHAIRRMATSVEYASDFQGPVDCVNPLNTPDNPPSLTIMGQQVLIGTTPPNQTVFANFTPNQNIFANVSTVSKLNTQLSPQLPPNPPSPLTPQPPLYNIVKVSGFSNGFNGFQATRIELIAQGVDLLNSQVPLWTRGAINGVDPVLLTFNIGNLTADFSMMIPAYVPRPLPNGLFVIVKGLSPDFTPGNAPYLFVQSITPIKEGPSVQEGDHVAVEGFVSGLLGSSFMVGGTAVNASTISLMGISNADMVEVEGTITNGVLMATQITPL